MITIRGPKSLTLPSALGGDDAIYNLVLVCATRGLTVKDSPDASEVSISGIRDTGLVSIQIVQLLLSKGAEVEGYPVFFEIDDITDPCPFSDDDETWETWGVFGESHKPVQIGDKWYRSNNVGASGTPLPASQWANRDDVLSVADYLALQNAANINESIPLKTYEVDVVDADGSWSTWFNTLLESIGITEWQFGSVSGKPRITAPITEEQLQFYVDRFKVAYPAYADITYSEIE